MVRGSRTVFARPFQPFLQSVIAPERFTVRGDEAGCARQAELGGAFVLDSQALLIIGTLGAIQNVARIEAERFDERRERRRLSDRPAFAEFYLKDAARKRRPRVVV